MLFVQVCSVAKIVLRDGKKLLNLLYPIPGKGSANHLLTLGVSQEHHHSALCRIIYHFELQKFGNNAGETLACESLPERVVKDVFS